MKVYRTGKLIRPDLKAHINSAALINNLKQLRSLCPPPCKFCAVVKANAYGHGIMETVNILKNQPVDFFAVASIYEAIHISSAVQSQKIIILEPINGTEAVEHIMLCAEKGFHCVASSIEGVKYAIEILKYSGLNLQLHLNIESGMGRCGLDESKAKKAITTIDESKCTTLGGVFTHFATADEEDLSYAEVQLNRFNNFLRDFNLTKRKNLIIHAANSAGCIRIPDSHFDMVRCGISLYGYYSRRWKDPVIPLKPVMKLEAPIVNIKNIKKGNSVSYGQSYITKHDTRAGLVPLGYADGYWRCFSNRASMKVKDCYVPVIGRVCMDQLLIDVTKIDDIEPGQMVTVIEDDHNSSCGVYALAEMADTICYEILTCVHSHINRIVH